MSPHEAFTEGAAMARQSARGWYEMALVETDEAKRIRYETEVRKAQERARDYDARAGWYSK